MGAPISFKQIRTAAIADINNWWNIVSEWTPYTANQLNAKR